MVTGSWVPEPWETTTVVRVESAHLPRPVYLGQGLLQAALQVLHLKAPGLLRLRRGWLALFLLGGGQQQKGRSRQNHQKHEFIPLKQRKQCLSPPAEGLLFHAPSPLSY